MSALVKGRRGWPAVLSLGFDIDRNGKRRKPVWINILTLGILLPGFAMWGLYRVFTTPTGIGLWALAVAMYLFTMFGVTLGNHRYWTHREFEARFPLQVVLAVASGMSMEGDIQQWVMNHRAHHRFADIVGKDPHSPYEYAGWRGYKGLVWAQCVWLFFAYERPPEYALHRDLAQDRLVQWQRRAFPVLAAAGFLVPLAFYPLFGWNAVLIAGALRTAAGMTAIGFVNSVCTNGAAGPPTAAGTSSARTTAATIRSWRSWPAAKATTAGTTPTPPAPATAARSHWTPTPWQPGPSPTAAGAPTPPGGSSSSWPCWA